MSDQRLPSWNAQGWGDVSTTNLPILYIVSPLPFSLSLSPSLSLSHKHCSLTFYWREIERERNDFCYIEIAHYFSCYTSDLLYALLYIITFILSTTLHPLETENERKKKRVGQFKCRGNEIFILYFIWWNHTLVTMIKMISV